MANKNIPVFRFVDFHEERLPHTQNDEEHLLILHIVDTGICGSALSVSAPNLHGAPARINIQHS